MEPAHSEGLLVGTPGQVQPGKPRSALEVCLWKCHLPLPPQCCDTPPPHSDWAEGQYEGAVESVQGWRVFWSRIGWGGSVGRLCCLLRAGCKMIKHTTELLVGRDVWFQGAEQ